MEVLTVICFLNTFINFYLLQIIIFNKIFKSSIYKNMIEFFYINFNQVSINVNPKKIIKKN